MAHKILVAVDGTDLSERALDYAARIARDLADSHLTLLSVGETIPNDFVEHDRLPEGKTHEEQVEKLWEGAEEFHAEHREPRERMFDHMIYRLERMGLPHDRVDTKYLSGEGDVSEDILNEAERGGYEAICLGRQGRTGMKDLFTGSVSDKVVRHARNVAVWVVE